MESPKRPGEIHRPERALANDRDRELLGDAVQSQGFEVFINAIVTAFIVSRLNDALRHVQKDDLSKAQACLAAASGASEIISGAYEGAGLPIPKEVTALVQLSLSPKGLKDALHERGPGPTKPASD